MDKEMTITLKKEMIGYFSQLLKNKIDRPYVEYYTEYYFLIDEIHEWCIENNMKYKIICEKDWLKIDILNNKDAMFFKLRWG